VTILFSEASRLADIRIFRSASGGSLFERNSKEYPTMVLVHPGTVRRFRSLSFVLTFQW